MLTVDVGTQLFGEKDTFFKPQQWKSLHQGSAVFNCQT